MTWLYLITLNSTLYILLYISWVYYPEYTYLSIFLLFNFFQFKASILYYPLILMLKIYFDPLLWTVIYSNDDYYHKLKLLKSHEIYKFSYIINDFLKFLIILLPFTFNLCAIRKFDFSVMKKVFIQIFKYWILIQSIYDYSLVFISFNWKINQISSYNFDWSNSSHKFLFVWRYVVQLTLPSSNFQIVSFYLIHTKMYPK